MSRPIEIQVVTQAEVKELEQIPDALEDVEKGLDNLEKAGEATEKGLDRSFRDISKSAENAGDDIEDAFKDATRETERSGEDMEDALKEVEKTSERVGKEIDRDLTKALEEVADEAKTTGRKVGRELDDGFDKAKRGAEDFKQEASQSARESAASFTGEIDDAMDLVQETLANAFGGFGPIGAAAGVALAAGAGAMYNAWNENAELTEERISDMFDDMIESGNRWVSEQYILQGVADILNKVEGAQITLADANRIAAETGIESSTVLRAYAGDAEAMEIVSRGLSGAIDASNEAFRQGADDQNVFGEAVNSNAPLLETYASKLEVVEKGYEEAAGRADAYTEAANGIPKEPRTEFVDNLDEQQKRVDNYQKNITDTPPKANTIFNAVLQQNQVQSAVNSAAARVIPPSVGINVRINQRQI